MLNIVLPARLDSTRLPGKMLAPIGGRTLVRHAVLGVLKAQAAARIATRVLVATDSAAIAREIEDLCPVQMTSTECRTGTDRVAEAAALQGWDKSEVVVNVQADMPFIAAEALGYFLEIAHASGGWDMLTAYAELGVVRCAETGGFVRDSIAAHIGVYAYTGASLARFAALPSSAGELTSRLEQLRAKDAGFHIRYHTWPMMPLEVNTPEDLAALRRMAGALA